MPGGPDGHGDGHDLAGISPAAPGFAKVLIRPTPPTGLDHAEASLDAQPLHRDDQMWGWPHPGPEARVQIMLAVTDFTAENGGTLVIPGSHHWPLDRAPRKEEALPTTMPAGSALMWLGGVYHGGGLNTSGQRRIGVTIAFDRGYLGMEENHYLQLPRPTVAALPPRIQRLLGYGGYEPGNGAGYLMIDGSLRGTDYALRDHELTE